MASSEEAANPQEPTGGPEGKPVTQADLEGLRAQLSDLRGKLRILETQRQSATLEALPGKFDDLALLVAETLEAIESAADIVPALDWSAMDAAERQDAMDDLGIWVSGILLGELESYCASVIKGCWRNHRAAVWELGNLWAEWKRIYGAEVPPLADALTWFDRWLPGVQIRLRDQMAACNPKAGCVAAKAAEAGARMAG
jgi:hypothetical protein